MPLLKMARLFKPNAHERASFCATRDGIRTARLCDCTRTHCTSAWRRARHSSRALQDTSVDQPPLEDDIGVEAEGGVALDEAGGAPAVEAGAAAVEDDIGAVASGDGAVAAGAAMVEDAAGFSLLSPLLPPHAASPTTNADATMIRVSFMDFLRAVGCQYLAHSLKRELRRAATTAFSCSDERNFRKRPQSRSMATAVASPPPMHNAATPLFPPRFCRALSRVTTRRAPEAPIG